MEREPVYRPMVEDYHSDDSDGAPRVTVKRLNEGKEVAYSWSSRSGSDRKLIYLAAYKRGCFGLGT
jgi:hypothetical protein